MTDETTATRVTRLLDERTRRLARGNGATEKPVVSQSYLRCRLVLASGAACHVGLPLADISGVLPRPRMAALPGAPDPVIGIFRHRGNFWTAAALAPLAGYGPAGETETLILLRNARALALGVADALDVLTVAVEDIVHDANRGAPHIGHIRHGEGTGTTIDLLDLHAVPALLFPDLPAASGV